MKRLFAVLLLIAVALGAWWVWHGPAARRGQNSPVQANGASLDPQPLSAAEQARFLPPLCGGASAGSGGYAHDCQSLPGYPSADYGGAGLGLGITLTSVLYGHLTSATDMQAYVSYLGSFEPHVNNFGGGVLFRQQGQSWVRVGWYPGGALSHCLGLNSQGRAKLLCRMGFTGQGESNTTLALVTLRPYAPGGGQLDISNQITASDLRDTLNPEANCGLRTSDKQAILLGIDKLTRTATGFAAQISYVPAAQAAASCAAHHFADAPTQTKTVPLRWDGTRLVMPPGLNFAPAS